jgi:hypothetical protein
MRKSKSRKRPESLRKRRSRGMTMIGRASSLKALDALQQVGGEAAYTAEHLHVIGVKSYSRGNGGAETYCHAVTSKERPCVGSAL